MKKLILVFFILGIAKASVAQTFENPPVEFKEVMDVYIRSVSLSSSGVTVRFLYRNSTDEGHQILINPPGNRNAFYLVADDVRYEMTGYEENQYTKGTAIALPGERIEFSINFQPIPQKTTKINILEGKNGAWNFSGIKLIQAAPVDVPRDKARMDYQLVSMFDKQTKKWSEFVPDMNSFFVNINPNGDILHLRSNGTQTVYKRVSITNDDETAEGKHFLLIKTQHPGGEFVQFQVFDDFKVGLKMFQGDKIIQYAVE